MNDNRNQQQQDNTAQNQNPTLDAPGSKVADYGNPDGGSGSDTAGQQQEGTEENQQNAARASDNNETIGNP